MTLILLIVIVGVSLILTGVLLIAVFELWRDHELAKAEQEYARRIELESCLRNQPPHISNFRDGGSKGFQQRRVS